ncbi:MAG: radical SAM protein, partial [uncultured bacterium]
MKLLCNYYVTLRCNARCEFCNIWRQKDNFTLLEQSLEDIEKNLKALKKLGVKIIDFTGGEPLLYPYLTEALKLAKKIGFYTTITTNCSLYSQYAENLLGLVDILLFSVQSSIEEEHNRITDSTTYQKIL